MAAGHITGTRMPHPKKIGGDADLYLQRRYRRISRALRDCLDHGNENSTPQTNTARKAESGHVKLSPRTLRILERSNLREDVRSGDQALRG